MTLVTQSSPVQLSPLVADSLVQSLGPDAATIGLFIAGIVLWLVGGRLMRAASIVALALAGAAVAYSAPAELDVDLHPLLTAALGLILGAFAGAILFRFSMAATLAVALSLAVATSVAFVRDIHVRAPEAVRPVDTAALLAQPAGDRSVFISRASQEQTTPNAPRPSSVDAALDRVLDVVTVAADDAHQRWSMLDDDDRSALRLAALAGVFFGFGLGMMAPIFAAAVVTASLGAGLVLSSGASLAVAHNIPYAERLPETLPAWALLWLLLAAVGALIQACPSRARRREAAKRPPRNPEAQPAAQS